MGSELCCGKRLAGIDAAADCSTGAFIFGGSDEDEAAPEEDEDDTLGRAGSVGGCFAGGAKLGEVSLSLETCWWVCAGRCMGCCDCCC